MGAEVDTAGGAAAGGGELDFLPLPSFSGVALEDIDDFDGVGDRSIAV